MDFKRSDLLKFKEEFFSDEKINEQIDEKNKTRGFLLKKYQPIIYDSETKRFIKV